MRLLTVCSAPVITVLGIALTILLITFASGGFELTIDIRSHLAPNVGTSNISINPLEILLESSGISMNESQKVLDLSRIEIGVSMYIRSEGRCEASLSIYLHGCRRSVIVVLNHSASASEELCGAHLSVKGSEAIVSLTSSAIYTPKVYVSIVNGGSCEGIIVDTKVFARIESTLIFVAAALLIIPIASLSLIIAFSKRFRDID